MDKILDLYNVFPLRYFQDNMGNVETIIPDDPALKRVKLLTAKQVAELLGVHLATVWRLTQRVENPLPVVRFGERITRFRLTEVEEFIASSAVRSG